MLCSLTGDLTLIQLKLLIHEKCLDMRTMDLLVRSQKFQEALAVDSLENIIESIKKLDVPAVQRWIDKALRNELGDLSIRKLRETAKNMSIPYYTSKTKDELIALIRKEKQRQKDVERTQKASERVSPQV